MVEDIERVLFVELGLKRNKKNLIQYQALLEVKLGNNDLYVEYSLHLTVSKAT